MHAEMKELEEAIQQETDYHTQQMEKSGRSGEGICGRRKQMLHAGVTEIHLRKKGTIRLSP